MCTFGYMADNYLERREVREYLDLPYEPLAVLAIGKGADRIELEPVPEGSDLRYYRQDGKPVGTGEFDDWLVAAYSPTYCNQGEY